jgi:hypothetical protein
LPGKYVTTGSGVLLYAFKHLPAFVPQAFAGFSAPFDAGGNVFLVDIVAAFTAFDAGLIRKYFHFAAATGAFMEGYFQFSTVLTRTMAYHRFVLLTSYFFHLVIF